MAAESSTQDSRKRTLEALERRLAVAKAELLTQQKKGKTNVKGVGKQHHTASYTSDSSLLLCGSLDTTPLSTSSKKGNFTFSGQATLQGNEEDTPAYAQFSQTVHENLLATKEEFSSGRESSVNSILHELLQKGDSASKYMQGSKSMKIDNWILLDNLVQRCGASFGSRTRALRVHSKRSKKHMSMKQHKKHGTLDLPRELHQPMHKLWKGYMQQLLNATGKNQVAQCLLDADLHGAIILVVECKVTSLTGVCGIVIRETAEAFGVITEGNKFQVIPKRISVFVFSVDCWKVTLYGDKLASRKLGS
ncbi:ribonuclease P protein subunit p29-like isoform X2 [Neltuma alba]|uniref:ribonuclease P protein subunit p29-like isoform X2 n=1 Tax=Neltuma alba TaxID=207710 RepID=UPI0010A50F30|nr:ribonuclease P protein subunit p29-like isoform X2 [Prosopis alba]XP_028765036.1 ribonuclease P protein subunit p29-like isoform X2 [Prosopis alba]